MTDPRAPKPQPVDQAYDSSDPKQAKDRENLISLRETRLRNIERGILATDVGREWFWGILTSINCFEPRIAMSGSDYENGYNNGHREAGLRLMRGFMRSSPSDFAKMISEQDR